MISVEGEKRFQWNVKEKGEKVKRAFTITKKVFTIAKRDFTISEIDNKRFEEKEISWKSKK